MSELAGALRRFPVSIACLVVGGGVAVRVTVYRLADAWLLPAADAMALVAVLGLLALYLRAANRSVAEIAIRSHDRLPLVRRGALYTVAAAVAGLLAEALYRAPAPAEVADFVGATPLAMLLRLAVPGAGLAAAMLGVTLLRAVTEEVLFRGLLLSHLRTRFTARSANSIQAVAYAVSSTLVLSAAIFTRADLNFGTVASAAALIYLFATLVLGLAWGYATLVSGSLWYPWVSNAVFSLAVRFVPLEPLIPAWPIATQPGRLVAVSLLLRCVVGAAAVAILSSRLRGWAYPAKVDPPAGV